MFLGIDCGTQGTKVLLWDVENQHGLVILDQHDRVIRPAKLWCDTESTAELKRFLHHYHAIHGHSLSADIGIPVPVAFTLGKLLWVKQHESAHFDRINKVMLPHDYLNYFLTGNFRTEPGDASGTGYFDTRKKSGVPRSSN